MTENQQNCETKTGISGALCIASNATGLSESIIGIGGIAVLAGVCYAGYKCSKKNKKPTRLKDDDLQAAKEAYRELIGEEYYTDASFEEAYWGKYENGEDFVDELIRDGSMSCQWLIDEFIDYKEVWEFLRRYEFDFADGYIFRQI
ncbi:MAG: hypothetical protein LBO69_05590 [Ignavibacteria bacterium]|jgi:hypothetical protein|nr:hypothetical protein [Ignavibacteria bacterium]